jgi:hypothetical protein
VDNLGEAIVFLAVVAVLSALAVRLGMLVAPHLGRLTEPRDEEDGGNDD